MINMQIESEPRFPWGATFLSFAGAVLVVGSIVRQDVDLAIGSIPLWTVATSLYLARQQMFMMEVGEDGLDVRHLGHFVAYDSINWLLYGGNNSQNTSQQADIRITHDRGILVIPARIDASSQELFGFLLSRFSPRQHTALPSTLQSYADEQANMFGENKVFRYVARENVKPPLTAGESIRAIGKGLIVACVAWFVIATIHNRGDWVGAGICLILPSLGFLAIGFIRQISPAARIRKWRSSGLVISPVGLALMQGTLRGRLNWDELRDVTFYPGARSFQVTSTGLTGGIVLKVEGSSLAIADLYNQPLEAIHAQIVKYWRGES